MTVLVVLLMTTSAPPGSSLGRVPMTAITLYPTVLTTDTVPLPLATQT
jgi:hypothetical protein